MGISRRIALRPEISRTQVSRPGVALHSLQPADAGRHRTMGRRSLRRHLLPRQLLDEPVDVEATAVPGGPTGGEDVIGSAGLVAERHVGAFAQEQRAVVAKPPPPPVRVLDHDLQVFGGVLVTHLGGLIPIRYEDHLAVVAPCRHGRGPSRVGQVGRVDLGEAEHLGSQVG